MKSRLLRKVRTNNPIRVSSCKKYQYTCLTTCLGGGYYYQSKWVEDPKELRFMRTGIILNEAARIFNEASFIYKRKRFLRWA